MARDSLINWEGHPDFEGIIASEEELEALEGLTESDREIWDKCYFTGTKTKAGNREKRIDCARSIATDCSYNKWTLSKILKWAESPSRRSSGGIGLDSCRAGHDWNQGLSVLRCALAMAETVSY